MGCLFGGLGSAFSGVGLIVSPLSRLSHCLVLLFTMGRSWLVSARMPRGLC